jgi:putative membrane protein
MFGYVAGLPAFLAYFAAGIVMLIAFSQIYAYATPHKELNLIRQGNNAAVVAYLGALLGFSMPLASAAAHSVSIVDFIIWAIIGGIVQVIAFFAASYTMDDIAKKITDGNVSAGAWAGGIALAVGLLNAACMTY